MAATPAQSLIVIRDWARYFETYESMRLKGPGTWVSISTKHDGRGYRRLVREKDGAALYGAWIVMVQVAKKMPVRGVLADSSGPLTALDLEDKTMLPAKTFERMLALVSSEAIGWAEIVTDSAGITAHLREVAEICTPRPRALRESPQLPADARRNGHSPADSGTSPADSGASRTSAGTPADSRTSAGTPADDRTSRARAGEQDRTLQDRTPHPERVGAPADALAETSAFLCGLFGQKRTRLSQAAEHQLAAWADSLPLSFEQKRLLAWFYGLPGDPENIDLRARHRDAEKLAGNLFAALERAEAYKKKSGADFGSQVRVVPAPAPPGALEWLAATYPEAPTPPSWSAVPESVRSEFELSRRQSA